MSQSNILKFPEIKKASFQDFNQAIQQGDVSRAGRALRDTMGMELETACHAAIFFHLKYQANPDLLQKAMRLRALVESGDSNGACALLHELFGFDGPTSLEAFLAMQEWASNAKTA